MSVNMQETIFKVNGMIKKVCNKDDLIKIVKGQVERENANILNSNKLIFCDTNILTTIAWSKTHYDGFCDPWIIRQSKNY